MFTVYKTLSSLLDAFLKLQETLKEIKKKHIGQCPQLALFDLHFYVVLDNVRSLLKIER